MKLSHNGKEVVRHEQSAWDNFEQGKIITKSISNGQQGAFRPGHQIVRELGGPSETSNVIGCPLYRLVNRGEALGQLCGDGEHSVAWHTYNIVVKNHQCGFSVYNIFII